MRDWLEAWARRGIVEQHAGGWRLTPDGEARFGPSLRALAADEEREAA